MFKRMTFMFGMILVSLGVFVIMPGIASAGPAPKVDICHVPPGNPENYHTITVSSNALPAHLAHGDLGGACNDLCATLCDDLDACTVDDTGDCETDGCPVDPREPTDCNDDNLCTTDSCDSDSGCANEPVVCNAPDLCTVSACASDTGECVDSPVTCPDGQQCNTDNGACEDVNNTCGNDDWTCSDPIALCGSGGVGDICVCDLDSNGAPFCWGNYYCSDTVDCTTNDDCAAGSACVTSCCGGGFTCAPTCPNPDQFATPQDSFSGEPTAAGN